MVFGRQKQPKAAAVVIPPRPFLRGSGRQQHDHDHQDQQQQQQQQQQEQHSSNQDYQQHPNDHGRVASATAASLSLSGDDDVAPRTLTSRSDVTTSYHLQQDKITAIPTVMTASYNALSMDTAGVVAAAAAVGDTSSSRSLSFRIRSEELDVEQAETDLIKVLERREDTEQQQQRRSKRLAAAATATAAIPTMKSLARSIRSLVTGEDNGGRGSKKRSGIVPERTNTLRGSKQRLSRNSKNKKNQSSKRYSNSQNNVEHRPDMIKGGDPVSRLQLLQRTTSVRLGQLTSPGTHILHQVSRASSHASLDGSIGSAGGIAESLGGGGGGSVMVTDHRSVHSSLTSHGRSGRRGSVVHSVLDYLHTIDDPDQLEVEVTGGRDDEKDNDSRVEHGKRGEIDMDHGARRRETIRRASLMMKARSGRTSIAQASTRRISHAHVLAVHPKQRRESFQIAADVIVPDSFNLVMRGENVITEESDDEEEDNWEDKQDAGSSDDDDDDDIAPGTTEEQSLLLFSPDPEESGRSPDRYGALVGGIGDGAGVNRKRRAPRRVRSKIQRAIRRRCHHFHTRIWSIFWPVFQQYVWTCSMLWVGLPMTVLQWVLQLPAIGNPTWNILPGNPNIAWWCNLLARESVMWELARFIQWFVVNVVVLGFRLSAKLLGPFVTLLLIQAQGWPFLIATWGFWNLLLIHDQSDFGRHWLYWTGWRLFQENPESANTASEVLGSSLFMRFWLGTILLGISVSVKRTILSIYFGRRQLADFKSRMEKLLSEVVLVSEIAVLADEAEALVKAEEQSRYNSVYDEFNQSMQSIFTTDENEMTTSSEDAPPDPAKEGLLEDNSMQALASLNTGAEESSSETHFARKSHPSSSISTEIHTNTSRSSWPIEELRSSLKNDVGAWKSPDSAPSPSTANVTARPSAPAKSLSKAEPFKATMLGRKGLASDAWTTVRFADISDRGLEMEESSVKAIASARTSQKAAPGPIEVVAPPAVVPPLQRTASASSQPLLEAAEEINPALIVHGEAGTINFKDAFEHWEEPTTSEEKFKQTTIQDVLKFERALTYFDEPEPFGEAFGPAENRQQCIDSATEVFKRLLLLNKGTSSIMLDFDILSLIVDAENADDGHKLRALRYLLPPDADNQVSMINFVETCDKVYKKLRFFRAAVKNASVTCNVLEEMVNYLFYLVLGMLLLGLMQINPYQILLSMTSVLVTVSFAFGPSISRTLEGIIFIAVRRPFDLGDRIVIAKAEDVANPGLYNSWFVEDVNLFTTTLRYARSNEVSTVSNYAISSARIVNCNRSPNAVVFLDLYAHVKILKGKTLDNFRNDLKQYALEHASVWDKFGCCRVFGIDHDLERVKLIIIFRHRSPWQDAPRIMGHRANLLEFIYQSGLKLDLHFETQPRRQIWYNGGDLNPSHAGAYRKEMAYSPFIQPLDSVSQHSRFYGSPAGDNEHLLTSPADQSNILAELSQQDGTDQHEKKVI